MHVSGPCADEPGRKYVLSQPHVSPIESHPPDLFVVGPERELLGRLAYDATAEDTHRFLVDVLRQHPEFAPAGGYAEPECEVDEPALARLRELEASYDATTPGADWWRESVGLMFDVDEPGAGVGFDAAKAALVGDLEAWIEAHGERLPDALPLAHVLLGGARAHAGDFVGAREAWQFVVDRFPQHPLRHRADLNLIEPGGFPCLQHPELARIPRAPVSQVGVIVPDAERRVRNLAAVGSDPRYHSDIIPGLPFVEIPAGVFTMGGTPAVQGRELPTRRVTISRPFLLSAWPVTRAVWARFRPADYPEEERAGLAGELPAVQHSWNAMIALCEHLSRETGRRVRLPTEAEWEYAARGGIAEASHPWGDEPPTPEHCNYVHPRPVPVGCYPPNGYGLFDCVGNSFEWVADYYLKDAYAKTPAEVTDPTGPTIAEVEASGLDACRAVRGGGWIGNRMCLINCRNAWRIGWPAEFRWCNLSARLVVE